MPESGRLLTAGGHLHGGGIRLELSDRTCGRTLFTSQPSWNGPIPLPLLHEPGPTKMSSFQSPLGIPVAAGDDLRLTAVYDNSRPHTRVMGIMMVYLAPTLVAGCEAIPGLTIDLGTPGPPTNIPVPLLVKPAGPLRKNLKSTWVGDYTYGAQRVRVKRGAKFTWRFVGAVPHDVTLVSGPVGFSSPWTTNGGTFTHTVQPSRHVQALLFAPPRSDDADHPGAEEVTLNAPLDTRAALPSSSAARAHSPAVPPSRGHSGRSSPDRRPASSRVGHAGPAT